MRHLKIHSLFYLFFSKVPQRLMSGAVFCMSTTTQMTSSSVFPQSFIVKGELGCVCACVRVYTLYIFVSCVVKSLVSRKPI